VWLIAAMFGSGLTLASFMKLTHTVFLGVPSKDIESNVKEVKPSMVIPMVSLAALCVLLGIFAFILPIKHFLIPVVPGFSFLGVWSPGWATIMIVLGLGVGLIIYLIGNIKNIQEADPFIGGEKLPTEERITGTGFYNTIKEMGLLKRVYGWAEAKWFDIYEQLTHMSFSFSDLFKKLHTGVLNTYILWVALGLVILFIVLMGR
jgi:NADH:ubiquinone oxidoreductase subunit 5 (subunit L)/multisubunit Na+/H+ antiporter MnhA subunit